MSTPRPARVRAPRPDLAGRLAAAAAALWRRPAGPPTPPWKELRLAAQLYLALVALVATALFALSVALAPHPHSARDWVLVALFALLATFGPGVAGVRGDARGMLAEEDSATSADAAESALLALGALLGPVPAIAAAVCYSLLEIPRSKKRPHRALFNASMLTITVGGGSWILGLAAHQHWGAAVFAPRGNAGFALSLASVWTAFMAPVLGAGILAAAARVSPRASGLFGLNLITDTACAFLGLLAALAWLVSPWTFPLSALVIVVVQRAASVQLIELRARTDAKTGLLNAVYFREVAAKAIERHALRGDELVLLVCDLDFLRKVNNAHGHQAGDVAIDTVAKVLRAQTRRGDAVCRFGGEEFLVLLPHTSLPAGALVAERIRAAIEKSCPTFDGPGGAPVTLRLTTSVGVAHYPSKALDAASLLHAADVAVYRAKAGGRNQVQLCLDGDADAPLPRE